MQKKLSPFIIWHHENTRLVLFIFQLFPILYYFLLSLWVNKGSTKKLDIYKLASVPGATKRGVAKKKNGIQGYASGQIMNNLESLDEGLILINIDSHYLLLFYLVKRLKTKMYQKYFQSILEPN